MLNLLKTVDLGINKFLVIPIVEMDNPECDNPLDQFNTLCVIGRGSYAKVVLVRKKSN